MLEGLYSIEGFNSERGLGRGQYGLTIVLAAPVVPAISGQRRDESVPLFRMLQERLRNSLTAYDRSYSRMSFHEDTWLLRSLVVGSDCACFGCRAPSGGALRYDSHNIDSPDQAAAILSTWLLWFNHVIAGTDFKQPFTLAG